MVLLRVGTDHDLVDEDARDGDVLGVDGAGLGDLADLGHDLAAVALGGQDGVEDLELHGLVGGGEVAHLVADGAADETDVDGDLVIEHVLLAVNLDDLGDVGQGLGAIVHLAALDARVDEGPQADLAHLARQAAGHGAVELGDLTLGQAVGLHLVVGDHVHPARLEAPVRADDAGDQPLVGKVLDAAGAVGLAAGVQQGEVAGVAGLEEALLDGLEVGLGGGDERHADGADGGAVLDAGGHLLGGDEVCLKGLGCHSQISFLALSSHGRGLPVRRHGRRRGWACLPWSGGSCPQRRSGRGS